MAAAPRQTTAPVDSRAVSYLQGLGIAEEDLAGWDVQVARRAGVDVGLVATRGPEVHIVAIVEKKAMSRRNTLEHLARLLDLYGYVTTRVPITETDHRLRVALGFSETWTDARWRYFALTELPFSKEMKT